MAVDLQLDHIDAAQKVTHNIWAWSEVKRDLELKKCQVLCRSCHRKKTTDNNENARGEDIKTSRLKSEDIPIIRHLVASRMKKREIADRFQVTPQTIRKITIRETWRHIP